MFKQIDTKQSTQPKATDNGLAAADDGSTAPVPNVTDPNLLAAGIEIADIVKTDGSSVFALVRNEDGTIDVDIVPAEGSKSTVSACIHCGDELKKYSDFAAAEGVNSQEIIKSTAIPLGAKSYKYYARAMYAQNSQLTVIVGYPNCTITLVYDIGNPVSPALLNSFGQSGSYSTSQLTDGTLYATTNYSVNAASLDNLTSYVPQTDIEGTAGYIPMSDIYTGTGDSNCYTVVSSVQMSDMPKLLYTKAFLGSYEDIYISSDSLLLA